MSGGETSLLELCSFEPAMFVHARAKGFAQWPIGMTVNLASLDGLVAYHANRRTGLRIWRRK